MKEAEKTKTAKYTKLWFVILKTQHTRKRTGQMFLFIILCLSLKKTIQFAKGGNKRQAKCIQVFEGWYRQISRKLIIKWILCIHIQGAISLVLLAGRVCLDLGSSISCHFYRNVVRGSNSKSIELEKVRYITNTYRGDIRY